MEENKERVFNVADFGATGNGKTNDACAIQAAVDTCSLSGGGRVYFAPGDYLSGTIDLRVTYACTLKLKQPSGEAWTWPTIDRRHILAVRLMAPFSWEKA